MSYNVKINVFEGPFDLLLHLVRVNEMDIYDIPLAEITRQYLDYIKEMEKLNLDVAGDFLVMAATLINIKSRTLMPPLHEEEEEEEEEEIDEAYENIRSAQDLMRRLIEYRQFKEMAVHLGEREDEQLRLFYRNSILPAISGQNDRSEDLREDISLLFSAFARVLEYAEAKPMHRVLEEQFSVEEKIESIRSQIAFNKRLSLRALVKRCINKQEIITLLLGLLELCRLREIQVRQTANFNDVQILQPGEAEDEEDE